MPASRTITNRAHLLVLIVSLAPRLLIAQVWTVQPVSQAADASAYASEPCSLPNGIDANDSSASWTNAAPGQLELGAFAEAVDTGFCDNANSQVLSVGESLVTIEGIGGRRLLISWAAQSSTDHAVAAEFFAYGDASAGLDVALNLIIAGPPGALAQPIPFDVRWSIGSAAFVDDDNDAPDPCNLNAQEDDSASVLFSGFTLGATEIIQDNSSVNDFDGDLTHQFDDTGALVHPGSFFNQFSAELFASVGGRARWPGQGLSCGQDSASAAISGWVELILPESECPADLTTANTNPGDADYGIPDGEVDGADLSYFVEHWLGSHPVADMTTINTNPGDVAYGIPDGNIDGADLSYYIERWLQGCG